MKTKFLTTGIFLVAAFSTNAYALSIAGYGFKIGSVVAMLDLKGVPNPTTQPTVAVVDATLDQIEYLCRNPSDFNVAPGQAGQRTVFGSSQVAPENIVDKGKAHVEITFEIPGPFTCVNPNWTYIEDSAAAKQITARISYYFCSGDPKTDSDPCYDGNTLTITDKKAGTVEAVCTINPVLRNSDGTVVKDQPYTCMQTSP